MTMYIGVKLVVAKPMLLGQARTEHAVSISKSRHTDSDEGYLVKYPDGYTSWCPKEVFERTHIDYPFDNPDSDTLTPEQRQKNLVDFFTNRVVEDAASLMENQSTQKGNTP